MDGRWPMTELLDNGSSTAELLAPAAWRATLPSQTAADTSPPGRHRRFAGRSASMLMALTVAERESVHSRFGPEASEQLCRAVAAAFTAELADSWVLTIDEDRVLVVVPGEVRGAEQRLGRARAAVASQRFTLGAEQVTVTPLVGFSAIHRGDFRQAHTRAIHALAIAVGRMDLVPVCWVPSAEPVERGGFWGSSQAFCGRIRLQLQVVLTFLVVLGGPYGFYVVAGYLHFATAATGIAYVVFTLILLGMALAIYAESFAALDPQRPPAEAASALPLASAVIAAYLPNEADTILETVQAFLGLKYQPGLQIVLAYNTPTPLPIERALAELAAENERLVLLPVPDSTSKAQNVNAALRVVTGEIVGIFDADHHPEPGAFQRAWRWLSNGYGVVQGHCVIRNGGTSWVSRMVAVEFESIYAVSHPGRAQLHGFGIFGGSNGYWHADLLRQVRLRGSMLTEDIDSSLRVMLRGQRIASDPALLSRELAPTRLSVLAGQRLRWAQGWSQVSLEYAISAVRSSRLSVRQKFGTTFLLCWREIYPWVSLQMLPLVAYVLLHRKGEHANFFVPLLLLSTLITFLVGPVQTTMAYLLSVPEIRAHRRWFLSYLVLNAVFYTEFKNTLARVAHLKQLMGEDVWRVTARDPRHAASALAERTSSSVSEPAR
jgi:cellulose synthase/poly-beta-1,6-N-acetylglucosamine synthase-like glycosyltransferase